MQPISARLVEEIWMNMSETLPDEAPTIIKQLEKEQPVILVYLMAVGSDILNKDERELLLYLGIVVWKIMTQSQKPIRHISDEKVDEIEATNMKMLEYLEGEPEWDFDETVRLIIENYNQVEVLKYVIEALMEELDEGETDIREENLGLMMIYLKTVIDCFDLD